MGDQATGTAVGFPVLDPERPATSLSLPPFVEKLFANLDYATSSLPAGTSFSQAQRTAVVRRAGEFAVLAERRPGDQARIMAHIAKLLLVFPGQGSASREAQAARAEAFGIALDDVPAWCVEEACRRWLRAECGNDGHWAPTPPELRKVAGVLWAEARGYASALKRLGEARVEQEVEQDADHRRRMLEMWEALLAELRTGAAAAPAPTAPDEAAA